MMAKDTDCVLGRPCLIASVHTDQVVSHICCFACTKLETAAGVCPFACSVRGVKRDKVCPAMMDKRYGDIE